jgi:polysaccharide biosynthesis transport protein
MDPLKAQPAQETKLHFLDYWRIIRIRKTIILAVFLLVVLTATLVTFILPKSYASTARIKIERDISDIQEMGGQPMFRGYDPYFIQTEFELIQSEKILTNVIADLNLNEVWGKKFGQGDRLKTTETMLLLKGRIDLRPVRNASLIEIRVYSEDNNEAARIANAIADAYHDYRLEERQRLSRGAIQALRDEFKVHEDKIKSVQQEADDLRKELKVSDLDPAGTGPTPMLEPEVLRHLKALSIEREQVYISREKQLSQLKEVLKEQGREKLKDVLPTVVSDMFLTELTSQLNLAEQKLVVLKKDLAPDHPEVLRAQAQVDDLKTKVNNRIDGIMAGLENQVQTEKAALDNLKAAVEEARTNDVAKAETSRPYFAKKGELEWLIRFRQILAMKIASEGIDLKLPKTSMVEIVDRAQPGQRPVRPNKPLNIALGIIIGLVVGVGLAFFIEYLDTSVKTIDDVERALQAPVLGVIPQNVGRLLDEGADSPHAEAYRVLRTNLLFSRKDDKLNTIVVVSAGAGEGKTTTAFNLATVFAQSGQRVLIVDSDLRRPAVHKLFRVTNSIGLTNYLLKQNTLEEVIQTSGLPSLDFMASGKLPSSSLGILSSAQMKDLINNVKQRYDFVFFDSPPIMGVSDASILASEVDLTLQVIQYRRYPQPMNIRAKQLIEKVGGNLVGVVLNNINMSQDESYYYYSGYYHDYYSKNEEMAEASGTDKASGDNKKTEIKQKY